MVKSADDLWYEYADREEDEWAVYIDQFDTLDELKFDRMLGREKARWYQDLYDAGTEHLIRLWKDRHGGGDD